MRAPSPLAALLLVIAAQFLPPALAVFLQDRDVSAGHTASALTDTCREGNNGHIVTRDRAFPKMAREGRNEDTRMALPAWGKV